MEENDQIELHLVNNPLSVIDEKPELTTLVAATKMQNSNESNLSNKILSKLSKGYTFYTVIKVISYSINETSFLLPYCLRRLGIIPFFIFLILISLSSVYSFYLVIDIIVKHNLFNNYHKIVQEKSNRVYCIIYYIINIIYHIVILILEDYLYLSLCEQILCFFGIVIDKILYKKIIILLVSIIMIEFPLSFAKLFYRPDTLYIIITILNIILNIIALIIVFLNRNNEDDIKLIKINLFEGISKDYLTCYSIIMTVMGWQNQISKQLQNFKIKTFRRFYRVIYLFFIVENILIIFICFVSTPLISDNADIIIFLLDRKNINLTHTLIIQIMTIIFGLVFHVIIAHHMQLLQENLFLILSLTIYKDKRDNFKINKFLSISFNLFILLLTNVISLLIKDITLIIILYGGILTTINNYLIPSIMYWMLVSKNSFVILLSWLIDFVIIAIGISAFILRIFL